MLVLPPAPPRMLLRLPGGLRLPPRWPLSRLLPRRLGAIQIPGARGRGCVTHSAAGAVRCAEPVDRVAWTPLRA